MRNELNVSEDRSASALCVGKIGRERRLRFLSDPMTKMEYRERVKHHLLALISRGYNSFLFCRWGYFELTVVECLRELQDALPDDDARFFHPMAVLPNDDCEEDLPDPDDYFLFVIYRDAEGIDLTETETAVALLNNASVLLYDNTEGDRLVSRYVETASKTGIETLDMTAPVSDSAS